MLKTATDEGEVSGQVAVSYTPDPSEPDACLGFAIGVTLRVHNLYQPRIIFDARLSHLIGDMLILIKPPPSNRFWYGFVTKPDTKILVVPQIQETRFNVERVNTWIEGAIKSAVSRASHFDKAELTR